MADMNPEGKPVLIRVAEAWLQPQEHLNPLIGTEGYRLPDISTHVWHRLGDPAQDNWFIAPDGVPIDRFKGHFTGRHNVIVYGTDTQFHGNILMRTNGTTIILGDHAGKNCQGSLVLDGAGHGGLVFIGANTTVNRVAVFLHPYYTQIIIGEDCMLSHEIMLRTSDEHCMFDMETGEHLDPPANIILEPHVWLCPQITVLRGVTIGFGSVVGVNSVVSRSAPAFSLVGGQPARVVRQNISWDRPGEPRAHVRNDLAAWYARIQGGKQASTT